MKKGRLSTIILIVIFIAGLSLVLYPTVSDYVNSMHQSKAIVSYAEAVAKISQVDYDRIMREARQYNSHIQDRIDLYTLSDQEREEYENALNISGDGVMGYIEIPAIDVALPIYHGTSDRVLQVAVGHLEWTSLPTGGIGTHCVLSGHRGLPRAKLFTHLDKLVEGDEFMIRVLDEVLTYQVDQILIVEPKDTEALRIVDGKDYCTLVTCTPYGINTHRLLVRGHRVENAEQAMSVNVTAEAIQIDPLLVSSCVCVPILIALVIIALASGRRDKNKRGKKKRKLK